VQVGESVFLKAIGNNARRGRERVEEWKIKKIGRKYFDVWIEGREFSTIQFHIEDHKQKMDYPDWELYWSMQDIEDEKEKNQILVKLSTMFGSYGKPKLTLDQLRRIQEIISE
jgi:hypothetical protein